jgi:hypothetical protein
VTAGPDPVRPVGRGKTHRRRLPFPTGAAAGHVSSSEQALALIVAVGCAGRLPGRDARYVGGPLRGCSGPCSVCGFVRR